MRSGGRADFARRRLKMWPTGSSITANSGNRASTASTTTSESFSPRRRNVADISENARKSGDREIVATRIFEAPRELVFTMWTDREHVAKWWGPRGFTNTIHEMDVRPGGTWRFVMHGPDGTDYPNR